jgi:hypothetical protein
MAPEKGSPSPIAQPKDIPYHFHAEGHAFSAHFVRPVDVPIAAQAATSLPTIGGHGHSRVENFDVPRLASFTLGETHVAGSWQAWNVVTTSATSVLKGLSVLDFLTADKIVSRLTGEYVADKKNRESHIIALGSHFENLRLGGFEVKVTLRHDLLLNSKNFGELADNLKQDKKADRLTFVGDGVAHCSLVDKIEVDPGLKNLKGFEINGHILTVPHFGKIALAEVLAEPGTITLTMLRMELGSPDGGGGTGGQTRTNGQPSPPTP